MPPDTETPAADKFTPGPWRVGNDEDGEFGCVVDFGGGIIADCGISNFPPHIDGANARLIAAAPDMLAALRALLVGCEWKDAYRFSDGTMMPAGWSTKRMPDDASLSAARAAIAKAVTP